MFENEVFKKVFGNKHPRYVHCMRLGVTPSLINRSTRWTSSSEENERTKRK